MVMVMAISMVIAKMTVIAIASNVTVMMSG